MRRAKLPCVNMFRRVRHSSRESAFHEPSESDTSSLFQALPRIANALWRSHHRPEQSHLQDQHRITAIFSDRTDFPIGTIELEAKSHSSMIPQGDVVEYRISQTGLQRPPRVSAGE